MLFSLKGKDILLQATAWNDLEDMMLGEISQLQKDRFCEWTLIFDSRIAKTIQTEWWVLGDGGGRKGESVFYGDRILV